MTDTRIGYGARCTWWDSIQKVGNTRTDRSGLPCCPHCGSVLFEMGSEKPFLDGADRYEATGHQGYRAMIEWARGKCFPNYAAMQSAYEARK